MEHETFWTLLHDGAHWEFELFLIFVFDVLISLIIWPFLKNRIYDNNPHHKSDDAKIAHLEQENKMIIECLDKSVSIQHKLLAVINEIWDQTKKKDQ